MTKRGPLRAIATVALSIVGSVVTGSSVSADVQMSLQDGRVSIVATDATVAEILAEWARMGQTQIVNAERIAPDRMTLALQNVGEQEALEVVLRMTGGYLAAWRLVDIPNASSFARIVVVPRGAAPMAADLPPRAEKLPDQVPAEIVSVQSPAADPARAKRLPVQAAPAVAPWTVPVQSPAADAIDEADEQPPVNLAGAVPAPSERTQVVLKARHALEVADPRQFRLPAAPGPVNGPRAGAPLSPGVSVPGTVVRPVPQPNQPPAAR